MNTLEQAIYTASLAFARDMKAENDPQSIFHSGVRMENDVRSKRTLFRVTTVDNHFGEYVGTLILEDGKGTLPSKHGWYTKYNTDKRYITYLQEHVEGLIIDIPKKF